MVSRKTRGRLRDTIFRFKLVGQSHRSFFFLLSFILRKGPIPVICERKKKIGHEQINKQTEVQNLQQKPLICCCSQLVE